MMKFATPFCLGTCLIESESSGIGNAVGGPNTDGSYDYGFFQINDKYWCANNGQGINACNIDCQSSYIIINQKH